MSPEFVRETGNPASCPAVGTMTAAERRIDAIMERPHPSPTTLEDAVLVPNPKHRPLAQMLLDIKTRHPDDYYLAGCLRIPLEHEPDSFPWFRAPHSSCGCPECEDAHVRTIQARADLVRQHIKAGRQEQLV